MNGVAIVLRIVAWASATYWVIAQLTACTLSTGARSHLVDSRPTGTVAACVCSDAGRGHSHEWLDGADGNDNDSGE